MEGKERGALSSGRKRAVKTGINIYQETERDR
jgi:hypothetical protein